MKTRPLSHYELSILERMTNANFGGADILRRQLRTAVVDLSNPYPENDPSIELHVESAERYDFDTTVFLEAYPKVQGDTFLKILLHVNNGAMHELEFVYYEAENNMHATVPINDLVFVYKEGHLRYRIDDKVVLDGANMLTFRSFHSEFKEKLGFPSFYGKNMNAWIDCMGDLYEPTGMTGFLAPLDHPFTLIIKNFAQFLQRSREVCETLVDDVKFLNENHLKNMPGLAITHE